MILLPGYITVEFEICEPMRSNLIVNEITSYEISPPSNDCPLEARNETNTLLKSEVI